MTLTQRIGVSTDSLFDVSFDEAMAQLAGAGFETFEIIPADFQGAGGFPYSRLNPGVWPRTFGKDQRRRLKDTLGAFSQVTVHAPHLGVDIGSRNPGVREESQRQYIECIEFAIDIGAKIVSFHHTGMEASIEFAQLALPYACEHDLHLAYENGSIAALREILDSIDHERFGLLLDVGHVANAGLDAADLIDEFSGRIVEIHASGVYRGSVRFPVDGWGIDHFPFELNDAVDSLGLLSGHRSVAGEDHRA